MVRDVLVATVMSIAVFGGAFGLLAVLFRAQVRGYDRTVATDALNDWTARLELLSPEERERVAPPAEVLTAMAALPTPGWRSGWNKGPVS